MREVEKKLILAAVLFVTMGAHAQTMGTGHWTTAELLERARHLRQLAAQGGGAASETLDKYPQHYTMLAFRSRDGGGELHEKFADVFFILDGHAAVLTGGTMLEAKTAEQGEERGSAVTGGSRQDLKAGDVVHIPAGTPHQMLVAEGDTVTYFVLKIQERP